MSAALWQCFETLKQIIQNISFLLAHDLADVAPHWVVHWDRFDEPFLLLYLQNNP